VITAGKRVVQETNDFYCRDIRARLISANPVTPYQPATAMTPTIDVNSMSASVQWMLLTVSVPRGEIEAAS
jgi:hypothetical protein